MKHLWLTMLIVLTGCGSGGGGSAAPSKELFSVWSATAASFVLDLTGFSFGTPSVMSLLTTGGEYCDCQFTVLGTQSSGNYVNASCTYRTGTGGGSDPGCSGGNETGTYTNANAVLTLCPASSACETYR